jgi:predicted amidophosphoribosyltransferase
MKVVRVICVDCGLGRSPLQRSCSRCASTFSATVKQDQAVKELARILKEGE